jgi:predicted metal-dependent hydrolase
MTTPPTDPRFAVLCEAKDHERPLVNTDMTFGRVIDEIVVPLEAGESFFVDGAPLKREQVKRLKIVRQLEGFEKEMENLHWQLRRSSPERVKAVAGDYSTHIESVVRSRGDDVTAQMMKAYSTEIRPKLKDYLPKREELITATLKVFTESIKLLAGPS